MLTPVLIDINNLNTAVYYQNMIFPLYDAYQNYYEAVNHITDNRYYLVYDGRKFVGIYGIYKVAADNQSAWLGWFGVDEKLRKRHYGSQILALFEKEAKNSGYKYVRIYTDRYDNDVAISFYQSQGYTSEVYCNSEDNGWEKYPILIFSKPLGAYPLVGWDSRNIGFNKQLQKEFNPTAHPIIRLLSSSDTDELTSLYCQCFKDDHYYNDTFKGSDLCEVIDQNFRASFSYFIATECGLGLWLNGKLCGFILAFDYFFTKETNIQEFNRIFTNNPLDNDYPYYECLHQKIQTLPSPVMYLVAIAVAPELRGRRLSSVLLDVFLQINSHHTIVSDVSNTQSLAMYMRRGFVVSPIDTDYNLVIKTC